MRVIEADVLTDSVYSTGTRETRQQGKKYQKVVNLKDVQQAGIMDVVAVVRCKDCIHSRENVCPWYCDGISVAQPDDYCSCGERAEC